MPDSQFSKRSKSAQTLQPRHKPTILFPCVLPPKGKLYEKFTVTDEAGTRLSTLSYPESLQVAACALRVVLLTAFGRKVYSELPKAVQQAENAALTELITRRDARKLDAENAKMQISELILLKVDGRKGESAELLKLAQNFMAKLVNNYAVIAVAQSDSNGRFFVQYDEPVIPDVTLTSAKDNWLSRLVSGVRVALGTRPVDVTLGLNNAPTCQSFHLRFMAGEGMYLREQKPIDYEETVEAAAHNAPSRAHLHLRPRLGQRFGHFYARYFPEFAKGETPRVRFRFREVPPGSLIRAAVTAISSLALIWVVAHVSAFRDPDTDAPAFLLAFPAIAATWLGFESSSRNLLEGRLAARISLIVTVMTSLAASALFVIDKATPDAELVWAGGVSFLWIEEVKWSILLAVSLANAIYLSYLYWLSTYEFYYFLTRPSGEGIERVA